MSLKPTNKQRSTRSKRLDPVVKENDKNVELNSESGASSIQHSSALKRSQRRHSKVILTKLIFDFNCGSDHFFY